jgi:hypothetical protein
MTDVLVVNHGLHHVCGVHDIGRRLFEAIPDSISHAYTEANNADEMHAAIALRDPNVVLVNYRPDLMPWVPSAVQGLGRLTVAVAHNYDPPTLPVLHMRHRSDGFDLTLVLETQPYDFDGVVSSGRPLPPPMRSILTGDVTVGSFGFAFGHKRFDLVAREIVALDKPATFRLHCPTAYFGGSPDHTEAVVNVAASELAGSDVKLDVSTDHRPSLGVVRMLAANDVNCLFYDPGQPDAGLSSALDYLLAAGRPIMVSSAAMFRHALPAAVVWPEHRLADVLADQDRHAVNVRERYDQLSAGYAAGIKRLLELAS